MKRAWPHEDMKEFYLNLEETPQLHFEFKEEDFLRGRKPEYFSDPFEDDE